MDLIYIDSIYDYVGSLPDDTEELTVYDGQFTYLPDLSKFKNMSHMCCMNNSNLTTLPHLPENLLLLSCTNNNLLASLPDLPENLLHLSCGYNDCLTFLPKLPKNLIFLDCRRAQHLASLPKLPNTLEYLDILGVQIDALPELPDSLNTLYCQDVDNIILPDILPKNLKNLAYGYTRTRTTTNPVKRLPCPLPEQLEELNLCGNQLIVLPELPKTLTCLWICDNNLNFLPDLPDSLTDIDIVGNPVCEFIGEITTKNRNIIRETIKKVKILNNFRHQYYYTKYKNKFRNWLWVLREKKIRHHFHPSYLIQTLVNEETDLDDVLNEWCIKYN